MGNRIIFFVSFYILSNSYTSIAQTTNSHYPDSIVTINFKNKEISIGTDTLTDYKIDGEKKFISMNIRTTELAIKDGLRCYKITTQNIPANSDNITTVVAYLDYKDLNVIQVKLSAKTDSAFFEYDKHAIKGWSQLPGEERKHFEIEYSGNIYLHDGNTPWIAGLINKYSNSRFLLPTLSMFSNKVNWKLYEVVSNEEVELNGRKYSCRKINAGPSGPPGYSSFHWYNVKSGRFIKSELIKEGATRKYLSELKNVN